MTILVTGATGMVGRHVVTELVKAGHRVRAFTRTPSAASFPDAVEVVGGELMEPPSLKSSLNGIESLYLVPVGRTARDVVTAAKRAEVRRIVVLSGALADTDDRYLAVERAVEDSGLAWTHVRPGEFAANWLDLAPAIKDGRVVRRPYGAAVTQATHEADIAAVVATVLVEDGHAGRIYTLAGPEALTAVEQVSAIARRSMPRCGSRNSIRSRPGRSGSATAIRRRSSTGSSPCGRSQRVTPPRPTRSGQRPSRA